MIPNFTGQRVTTVSVDFMVRFFTDEGWQFDLEGDVEIRSAGRDVIRLDKDGPGTPVPEVLGSISGQEIRNVRVSQSGDLDVTLESVTLVTRADDRYESWQVYGPKGEIIVCMPGGELAIWGPRTT